jgi:hypothetical protein
LKTEFFKSLKEGKFMDKKHIWVIVLVAAVAFGFFAASTYWGKFTPGNTGLLGKDKAAIAAPDIGRTLDYIKNVRGKLRALG